MIRKNIICIIVILFGISRCGIAQQSLEAEITNSIEEIQLIKLNIQNEINELEFAGIYNGLPAFLSRDEKGIDFFVLDETLIELKRISLFNEVINDPYNSSFKLNDSTLFYSKMNFDSPDDYGYHELYLLHNDVHYFLDSIYNSDKKLHVKFSKNGQKITFNSLNRLSDYYNPQDNQILLFDLEDVHSQGVQVDSLTCMNCSDSYLINDNIYFTIARRDGYDGFAIKDIYVAPLNNLSNTVKLASNAEIIAISPDGGHILASKFSDRQKDTHIIIDVKSRKYQMVIGRDYANFEAFYSAYKNQFAYIIKGRVVYIHYPEEFPFDALVEKNTGIPLWTDIEFWKKLEHPNFDD